MLEKNLEKYSDLGNCPARTILDRVGDKWSILVLLLLSEAEMLRFNELHRYIGGISQKMLTVTLKHLEEDGLVSRKVYAVVPPKVEYTLTARGLSLMPHILALVTWAQEHGAAIRAGRN